MADIKDLIGAIVNKDSLSVKEIFAEIIGEKIGERMDALRPLVADAMFNEGKMKCDECGYGMAKEDSNCKKCGCSMNEDYDWDSLVDEEINESDDNEPLYEGDPEYIKAYNDYSEKHDKYSDLVRKHRIAKNAGADTLAKDLQKHVNKASKDRKVAMANMHQVEKDVRARMKNVTESDDNVKDDAPDTVAKDHPLVQLKKIIDTKGGVFRTSTGKKVNLDHGSAKRLLALHNATQKSEVKQKFASAVHRDPTGTHDMFFPKAKIGEETELDELSRRTLGSYATKAMNRGDIAVRMSKSDDDGMGKIANKRFAGVKLAARKIATSAGAGRATATAVAKNVDAAKAAGQGASSGSNKDREDSGKSYYAAQRNITKLRNMGEESELNELDKPSDGKDTILSRYIEKNKAQKFRDRGQSFERGMGLDTATDKIKGTARVPAVTREESELDEISKGLVTNYFHAAEKDSESRGKRIDRLKSIPVKTKKDQEGLTTLRKGLQKIQNKRTRGMGMAMNKYSGNAKVNATEETEE